MGNELRLIGQRYKYQYGESIPCEQLVSWLCDIKQAYTQSGGKRPFGVSILYMGWDKQEYKEDETSLQGALDLSIKVLSKTLDMTKLAPEKIELATLTRENGKTQIKILPADKVDELIKKYEKAEAEIEAAKKEKEKSQAQKP